MLPSLSLRLIGMLERWEKRGRTNKTVINASMLSDEADARLLIEYENDYHQKFVLRVFKILYSWSEWKYDAPLRVK